MPIYEYVCKACGHETEIMHRISDPQPKKCPECGKLKLSKQVSAGGFRLSGGGWYETDFKSGNKRNVAGDRSEPATKPAGDAPVAKESAKDGKKETKEPKKESKEPKKETKKDSKPAAPKAA